jgi:hypothetical protein
LVDQLQTGAKPLGEDDGPSAEWARHAQSPGRLPLPPPDGPHQPVLQPLEEGRPLHDDEAQREGNAEGPLAMTHLWQQRGEAHPRLDGPPVGARGTPPPSRIDIVAITAFNADTLVLGESLLGVDWVLGPSDRFAKYAFNVVVARILTPTERKHLRAIVEYLKPAHTHFVDLVEPFPPVVPDYWELGLSHLGEATVLH